MGIIAKVPAALISMGPPSSAAAGFQMAWRVSHLAQGTAPALIVGMHIVSNYICLTGRGQDQIAQDQPNH